jgi:tyrosine-protein phosphatase YwqE
MFSLFKKKESTVKLNYEPIMVDMHSHVLPGIDDGAQTPQQSIELIKKMMEVGIRKIIATPHVMADYYRNTSETIGNALAILKAELEKQHIDIEIEAAAEHYFDETFEARVNEQKLFTMGDNYALFELSFVSLPLNVIGMIQRMKELGYKPILAHPERYAYLDIEQLRNLRDWGCSLQINTISLTGYYGKETRKTAESMIDNEIVDFISSDMHHLKHAAAFKNALTLPYLQRLLTDYPLKNIMLK